MEYLALDVGGSSIKHAIIDDRYRLSEKGSVPTSYVTSEEFIETIGRIHDRHAGRVAGIAISSCGELDPATGYMFSGGALRFNAGTNLIELVQARCHTPVSVENDANCALLAEFHDGSLADCTNAVALVIGTAIGGAILMNRHIYHGSHFHSGNASHTMPSLSEPYNRKTILGSSAGVGGLTGGLAQRKGLAPEVVDGRMFFDLVNAGDLDAEATLNEFCERLAAFVYNVQVMLDVDAFAIGGGISAQPVFIQALRSKVDALFDATFIPLPRPEVRVCAYYNDANLLGALYHHLHPRV